MIRFDTAVRVDRPAAVERGVDANLATLRAILEARHDTPTRFG